MLGGQLAADLEHLDGCDLHVSPPGLATWPRRYSRRRCRRGRRGPRWHLSVRDQVASRRHDVVGAWQPCLLQATGVRDGRLRRGQQPRRASKHSKWRLRHARDERGAPSAARRAFLDDEEPGRTLQACRPPSSSSKGTRVRGSMTSSSMPSPASRSAASRARWRICWVATTVTSLPAPDEGRLAQATGGGRDLSLQPQQVLVLEDQHRVVVAHGRPEQAVAVLDGSRHGDLQARER